VDDIETGSDHDRDDPARVLFLSVCTMALAVVFMVMLVSDSVSATTF